MFRLDSRKASLAVMVALLSLASAASAAPMIIDNFEGLEGHFGSAPTTSGSNRNVSAGTADLSTEMAYTGTGSEKISFTAAVPPSTPTFAGTMLRFLSGGGTPANNTSLPASGYVGYFLATTTAGLRTGVGLDDGAALERGALQDVIADGQFHLYQFDLDNADDFDGFAGTGPNGQIDADSVTFDSIFILGPEGVNAVVYLDTVAHNPDGDLTSIVPEPTSAAVLGAGMLALSLRRRRA